MSYISCSSTSYKFVLLFSITAKLIVSNYIYQNQYGTYHMQTNFEIKPLHKCHTQINSRGWLEHIYACSRDISGKGGPCLSKQWTHVESSNNQASKLRQVEILQEYIRPNEFILMLSFTLINASYLSSPFQISYPIVQMAMPINANDFLQKIDRNIDFSEGSLKKKILARGDKNETDCHCLLIVGNSV